MIPPRTLALDLGTTTGWAMDNPEGGIDFGCWPLLAPLEGYTGLIGHGVAASRLRHHLEALSPGALALEEVRHGRRRDSGAAHRWGALAGVVVAYAYEHAITVYPVNVATVKRLATGSGRAEKREMIRRAQQLFGASVKNHNAADALLVHYAARVLQG
jgi:hypothetical protein